MDRLAELKGLLEKLKTEAKSFPAKLAACNNFFVVALGLKYPKAIHKFIFIYSIGKAYLKV